VNFGTERLARRSRTTTNTGESLSGHPLRAATAPPPMASMPAINACVLSQMRYWPMPALTLEGAAVKTLLHGEALDFFDGDPQELAGFPIPSSARTV
jgi:hypothetical protein